MEPRRTGCPPGLSAKNRVFQGFLGVGSGAGWYWNLVRLGAIPCDVENRHMDLIRRALFSTVRDGAEGCWRGSIREADFECLPAGWIVDEGDKSILAYEAIDRTALEVGSRPSQSASTRGVPGISMNF